MSLFNNILSSDQSLFKNTVALDYDFIYKCHICGIDEWNDKAIVLQLDHINGVKRDNRIENLRFLCPNCHSQTDTFAGKNKKAG